MRSRIQYQTPDSKKNTQVPQKRLNVDSVVKCLYIADNETERCMKKKRNIVCHKLVMMINANLSCL